MVRSLSAARIIKAIGNSLSLKDSEIERLIHPEEFLDFDITIEKDDGDFEVFKGYFCKHNSILGPADVGITFDDSIDADQIKEKAMYMMLKSALLELPFGGGAGGIALSLKYLSEDELKKACREFAILISELIGRDVSIVSSDYGTNEVIIDWMVHESAKIRGLDDSKSCFMCKSVENDGIEFRGSALAIGVARIVDLVSRCFNNEGNVLKVAIQGYGNVGSSVAKSLSELNAKIIGLSNTSGSIFCKSDEGFDPFEVLKYKAQGKGFSEIPGSNYDTDSNKVLNMDCDVLVLAAAKDQITSQNADQVNARIVVECANSAITEEAVNILEKKGIVIIPNILAQCGAVILNYFEYIQNLNNEHWTRDQVEQQLFSKLDNIISRINEIVSDKSISFRQACYRKAISDLSSKIKY